jgi:hypothetical protein
MTSGSATCCCGRRYKDGGGASSHHCPVGERKLCEECATEGKTFLGSWARPLRHASAAAAQSRSPPALERDDNDVDVDLVSLLHFLVLHATRGLVMTDSTFPKATTETATHRSDLPPRDCSEAPA